MCLDILGKASGKAMIDVSVNNARYTVRLARDGDNSSEAKLISFARARRGKEGILLARALDALDTAASGRDCSVAYVTSKHIYVDLASIHLLRIQSLLVQCSLYRCLLRTYELPAVFYKEGSIQMTLRSS